MESGIRPWKKSQKINKRRAMLGSQDCFYGCHFGTGNENCSYRCLASCTWPKWPNQDSSLDFCSQYTVPPLRFTLVGTRDLKEIKYGPLCFRISLQLIFKVYLFIVESFYMLPRFILFNFKKRIKMFFCPQKVEKTTSKSCILMAVGSYFLCSPKHPKQPRTSFPFYKLFYPIVSAQVSGGELLLSLQSPEQGLENLAKLINN